MKITSLWAIGVFCCFMGVGCQNEEKRQEKARIEAQQTLERERIEQEKKAEEEKIRQEKLAETEKIINKANETIALLKPHFKYEKDKFNNHAWYTHKNYSSLVNTIEAYINQNPHGHNILKVRSVYWGSNWIFHEKIIVKIEGTVKEFIGETKREADYGGVYESIAVKLPVREYRDALRKMEDSNTDSIDSLNNYIALQNRESDLVSSLVSFIASNPSAVVDVRLEGDKRLDFILSKSHHVAICETWDFYQALKIQEKVSKGEPIL